MSTAPTIGMSYYYRPWSCYRYLEDALRTLYDVRYFGSPYGERPGYFPADHLLDFVADHGRCLRFFFSNEDTLFRHLPDLACPTVIWIGDYWPGDYHRPRIAKLFDFVFVSARDAYRDFTEAGCTNVHWLPFACDPHFHRDHYLERIYEVAFVGFTNRPTQQKRRRLLDVLSQRYRMNDFRQPVFLEDMARVYSQSKIVLNIPDRHGFNMRVFEAMACGALLVTEEVGKGQEELFQDGVHLVTYRTEAEMFEKIEYYLAHQAEREAIAIAGQREVLAHHTYLHRARAMAGVVERNARPSGRTTDYDEILRIYALAYSRQRRFDGLLDFLCDRRGSLPTRAYVGARLMKSVYNQVFRSE